MGERSAHGTERHDTARHITGRLYGVAAASTTADRIGLGSSLARYSYPGEARRRVFGGEHGQHGTRLIKVEGIRGVIGHAASLDLRRERPYQWRAQADESLRKKVSKWMLEINRRLLFCGLLLFVV